MADTPQDHENGSEQTPIRDESVDGLIDGLDAQHDAQVSSEGLIPARVASVRFNRSTDSVQMNNQARMDTANQSLADALKITYGFLQFGMLILLVLFVFSGFQKINEGERGISVFMGKPSRTQLEPGAHLTWPYPIGELIRVGGGAIEVPLAAQFMPKSPSGASYDALLEMPIDRFSSGARLSPMRDGSLITADINIAHTQWTVNYHRSDHIKFVKNILPEQERQVVLVAARRGVVRTMAQTNIDDLLKKSAEAIAAQVREIAQETLDTFESGITIDRVVLVRKTPPLALLDRFASVQSAAQNAGKAREDSLLLREQELNQVAGRAASVLISMIDDYEKHIKLGEDQQAVETLEMIDTVLAGGETNYQDQSTLALVSGEISEILNYAQSSSSGRVSEAIAGLELFRAKQAQYDANPTLMIARDWSSAIAEFLNKDFVTTMYIPEGVSAELLINPDPDIERERDRLRKRAESLKAMLQRRSDFKRDAYKSQRGIEMEQEE